MLIEIRIYRRHDADIIMLKSYGVNISRMMRLALENYVNGERIKFRLPDAHACDISECSMLRYRLNVKNPKVIQLMKSIKRGYRNQFCKALLRDMLDSNALGVYLDTEAAIEFEDARLATDAMVAGDKLGLITKRSQITSGTFFVHRQNADDDDIEQVVAKVKRDESRAKKEDEKRTEDFFTSRSGETGNKSAGKKQPATKKDVKNAGNTVSGKSAGKAAPSTVKSTAKATEKPFPSRFDGLGLDDGFDDDGFSGLGGEMSAEEQERKEEERQRNLSSMFAGLLQDAE